MQQALERGELPSPYISIAAGLRQSLINRDIEVRYIALVRDQLERTLAALFQTMHGRNDNLTARSGPEAIFDHWRTKTNHTYGLKWFDHEYRDQLGVDVYDRPFDKEKRYQIYPEHKLLLLRIDCEPARRDELIGAHVGRPVQVGHDNVGDNKGYAEAYRQVKDLAWAPERLIEEIYSSSHMRHFWTEDELSAMAARWRRNRPEDWDR